MQYKQTPDSELQRTKSLQKGFTDKAWYLLLWLPGMVMLLWICYCITLDPSLCLVPKYHHTCHWFMYVPGALTLLTAWKSQCGPVTVVTQCSWKMVSKYLINFSSSGLQLNLKIHISGFLEGDIWAKKPYVLTKKVKWTPVLPVNIFVYGRE